MVIFFLLQLQLRLTMAQWMQISQKLPYFTNETLVELYPTDTFPIDVRHYLANWIEEQRWYNSLLSLMILQKNVLITE